jgi:cation:H+ antiporter
MTTPEIIIYLLGGIILLFAGAEGLVRGSSSLALNLGISPLVIGLTIVGFATSSPELVVSIRAAIIGNSEIVLGNVIGSNIANIALILGCAALIKPLKVNVDVIRKEVPILIGVSILLIIILIDGEVGFFDGIIFIAGILVYIIVSIVFAKKEKNVNAEIIYENEFQSNFKTPLLILLIITGAVFLVFGANIFLKSAIALSKLFGMSDALIGLTVVAIGTSLPELITSVVAAFKNKADIAIGNAVGSSIFNILFILGVTAVIMPISSRGISYIDLGVLMLTAVILLPMSFRGYRINRVEGLILLLGYILYIYQLLPV